MTNPLPPLLLIGGGKMGAALLAGWREQGLAPSIVIDPAPAAQALAGPGVSVLPTLAHIPPNFAPACTVLAVKPQTAPDILAHAAPHAAHGMALSIMAGIPTARLAAALGPAPLVRAMPNTPAAIRRGITVAFAGPGVAPAQHTLAHTLLAAVGEVAWVTDEALIDPVTAISGGGPAYVFLLAELLEQAGLDHGLPADLARQLARTTIAGAGALMHASPDSAATLRINVTSPAGTTERALAVLMADDAWPPLIARAITAATDRSRELGITAA